MGQVSTCQKNRNTIDLRGAQVNKHIHMAAYTHLFITLWFAWKKLIYSLKKIIRQSAQALPCGGLVLYACQATA